MSRIFNMNAEFSIRTVTKNEEILFVAADLSLPLGIKNIHNKLKLLGDDEKGLQLLETLGGKQKMSVVTEAGLYILVCSCPTCRARIENPLKLYS